MFSLIYIHSIALYLCILENTACTRTRFRLLFFSFCSRGACVCVCVRFFTLCALAIAVDVAGYVLMCDIEKLEIARLLNAKEKKAHTHTRQHTIYRQIVNHLTIKCVL